MDLAQPKWTRPRSDWLHSSKEVLPVRSEQRQNTKFSWSKHWKWSRLADDDLPPSPEKNEQAKTHKTQVWPRKAERSQRVGNLPSYDRREVCISHHHEQRRYRHRFNDHHLQHSSDWNSQWDPRQTSSKKQQQKNWITAEILDLCDKRRELRKKKFEPEGSEKYKEVNNNIKRCMKKAKENWIGEQCSEIEENLRKNSSKRAYQLE